MWKDPGIFYVKENILVQERKRNRFHRELARYTSDLTCHWDLLKHSIMLESEG